MQLSLILSFLIDSISLILIPVCNASSIILFIFLFLKLWLRIYLSSLSYLNKNRDLGISIEDIEGHTDGLFCFLGGEFNPLLILHNQNKQTDNFITKLKRLFKNNLLFELQRINDSNIDSFESYLIEKSYKFNIPLIGTNNIKFGEVDEFSAHDALLCVAQKTTINSGNRKTSNNQIAFKSNDQMIDIFFDLYDCMYDLT